MQRYAKMKCQYFYNKCKEGKKNSANSAENWSRYREEKRVNWNAPDPIIVRWQLQKQLSMKPIERIDYGNESAVPARMEIPKKLSKVCSRIWNRIQNGIVQMNVIFWTRKISKNNTTRQQHEISNSFHAYTHTLVFKEETFNVVVFENLFEIPRLVFFCRWARIIYTFSWTIHGVWSQSKNHCNLRRGANAANEMIILIVRCASVSIYILSVMNYGPYCFCRASMHCTVHILHCSKTFAFGWSSFARSAKDKKRKRRFCKKRNKSIAKFLLARLRALHTNNTIRSISPKYMHVQSEH